MGLALLYGMTTNNNKKEKNMDFQIGEDVLLNGKTYKIIGTVKRSFLLEKDGKKYKATAKMMGKIKDQNSRGVGVGRKKRARSNRSAFYHMEKRFNFDKIFNKDAKIPETEEELMKALDQLCGELEPENISCDGECSMTQIRARQSAIRGEWKEIERKLGKKVSHDEACDHWMAQYRLESSTF